MSDEMMDTIKFLERKVAELSCDRNALLALARHIGIVRPEDTLRGAMEGPDQAIIMAYESSRPAQSSTDVKEELVSEAWLRTVEARHAESEAFLTSRGKEAPDCHRDRGSLLDSVRRLNGEVARLKKQRDSRTVSVKLDCECLPENGRYYLKEIGSGSVSVLCAVCDLMVSWYAHLSPEYRKLECDKANALMLLAKAEAALRSRPAELSGKVRAFLKEDNFKTGNLHDDWNAALTLLREVDKSL